MNIFISMGMKSKSTEQVKQEMAQIVAQIQKKLPEAKHIDSVIDGADKELAIKGDDVGAWFLGESLKMMAKADIVFFVEGYKEFRGCRIERDVAEAYGKYCIDIPKRSV